uniref:Kruppel-like transcription factor 13 n=1 Tax=Mus musculus TaxID=10090 RepID=V9GX95_MOUSE
MSRFSSRFPWPPVLPGSLLRQVTLYILAPTKSLVRGLSPAAGRSATRSSHARTSWHGTIARTRARRSSAAPSVRSASCGATT